MKMSFDLGLVLILISLSGCASPTTAVLPPSSSTADSDKSPATGKAIDKAKTTVEIDTYLLEECENFSSILRNPSPNQVLSQHARDVAVLNKCAERHRSLVKILKDAFNIK